MMRSNAIAMSLLGFVAVAGWAPNVAARQLAIVVGNDSYAEVTPLRAGVNDARAMADGLKRAGFAVELVENGTKRQISRALATVEGRIEPGDTVVFHFSGHGFEIDGQNWLLPVDVPAARQGEAGLVKDESFNAAEVVDRLRARGAGAVVAILDACRNNPFAQGGTRALSGTRGLARMDASGGVFIMFSAGSKQEALDKLSPTDAATTSIFTRTLLPLIGRSDLSLIDMAKETQEKVRELARSVGHDQVPAYYDGIVGRVTLTGVPVARIDPRPQSTDSAVPAPANTAAEDTFWQSIRDSDQPAMFEAYLTQVQKKVFGGAFASIAEQKLTALRARPAAPDAPSPSPTSSAPAPNPHVALADPTDKRPLVVSDDARSPDIVACDEAASDPRDSDRPANVNGIELDRRTFTSAVTACKKAIAVAGAPRRVFYQLSRAYEAKGEGVDAVNYLRKAADLGHPLASYALAERLVAGRGVPKDSATAMALYFKAADAGLNVALVRIGMMYAQGDGAERDYVKAVALFNLALKVREPSVYPELGALYFYGRGVTKDKRKACDLFEQGASLGNRVAARNVSSFCKS